MKRPCAACRVKLPKNGKLGYYQGFILGVAFGQNGCLIHRMGTAKTVALVLAIGWEQVPW